MFLWDLINGKEEPWQYSSINPLTHSSTTSSITTFSPSLTHCITVDLKQAGGSSGKSRTQTTRKSSSITAAAKSAGNLSNSFNNNFDSGVTQDRFAAHLDSYKRFDSAGSKTERPDNRTKQRYDADGKQKKQQTTSTERSNTKIEYRPSEVSQKTMINWSKGSLDEDQEPVMLTRLRQSSYDRRCSSPSTPRHSANNTPRNHKQELIDKIKAAAKADMRRKSSTRSGGSEVEPPEITEGSFSLEMGVSSVCFFTEEDILIGTTSGHVILMDVKVHETLSLLGSDDEVVLAADANSEAVRSHLAHHIGPVTHASVSADASTLISADEVSLCLWDSSTRRLTMAIRLDPGQEVSRSSGITITP